MVRSEVRSRKSFKAEKVVELSAGVSDCACTLDQQSPNAIETKRALNFFMNYQKMMKQSSRTNVVLAIMFDEFWFAERIEYNVD